MLTYDISDIQFPLLPIKRSTKRLVHHQTKLDHVQNAMFHMRQHAVRARAAHVIT